MKTKCQWKKPKKFLAKFQFYVIIASENVMAGCLFSMAMVCIHCLSARCVISCAWANNSSGILLNMGHMCLFSFKKKRGSPFRLTPKITQNSCFQIRTPCHWFGHFQWCTPFKFHCPFQMISDYFYSCGYSEFMLEKKKAFEIPYRMLLPKSNYQPFNFKSTSTAKQ